MYVGYWLKETCLKYYIYIYSFSRCFYPKRLTIEEYNKQYIIKRQTVTGSACHTIFQALFRAKLARQGEVKEREQRFFYEEEGAEVKWRWKIWVPLHGNFGLHPLEVTMGNAVSVTRVWSIHTKTQPVGDSLWRQYRRGHNIKGAGRIHHPLLSSSLTALFEVYILVRVQFSTYYHGEH